MAGYPSGRTTSYPYTDGSTSAGGYDGAVPPKGLPYQETTPGGAVTTTLYYADGDVAQVTDPDGQRTVTPTTGSAGRSSETVYSDTYPAGLATTYAYDANGDLATETDPAVTDRVTGAVHTAQTTTSYDPDGDVTSPVTADLTGQRRLPHRHQHLQPVRPARQPRPTRPARRRPTPTTRTATRPRRPTRTATSPTTPTTPKGTC